MHCAERSPFCYIAQRHCGNDLEKNFLAVSNVNRYIDPRVSSLARWSRQHSGCRGNGVGIFSTFLEGGPVAQAGFFARISRWGKPAFHDRCGKRLEPSYVRDDAVRCQLKTQFEFCTREVADRLETTVECKWLRAVAAQVAASRRHRHVCTARQLAQASAVVECGPPGPALCSDARLAIVWQA